MKKITTAIFILVCANTMAQTADKPFIKLVEPLKPANTVKAAQHFIVGSTCKSCNLTINGQAVQVYPTGAFAYELNLHPGDTSFTLIAFNAPDKSVNKINPDEAIAEISQERGYSFTRPLDEEQERPGDQSRRTRAKCS